MQAVLWLAIALGAILCLAQAPPPGEEQEEGPPRLRRGIPPPRKPSSSRTKEAETTTPATGREIVVGPEGKVVEAPRGAESPAESVFEQVREQAFRFSQGLPNFLCDQTTWRYTGETLKPVWKLRDRVTAEVVYEGGREQYRNIKINDKPLKKGSPEASGTWSTGEFGTILQNLLATAGEQDFRFRRVSTAAGGRARVYDYSIPQERSGWRVEFGGVSVYPAYRGSLWIDPESLRVLRIEMQARRLPASFPMDPVEMTVDYGHVRIADKQYLLPVRSENLSCRRGTTYCTRNEIEFRNYRKFTAESTVTTTDSTITFEGDQKKTSPPKP